MKIQKSSKNEIINSLDSIAKDLILRKAIKINNTVFSIIDIEIYYYHKNHLDEYAIMLRVLGSYPQFPLDTFTPLA